MTIHKKCDIVYSRKQKEQPKASEIRQTEGSAATGSMGDWRLGYLNIKVRNGCGRAPQEMFNQTWKESSPMGAIEITQFGREAREIF